MRLIIIEADPIVLQSLKILLAGEPSIEIVGACSKAEDALTILDNNSADIMIVDLGLHIMSNIAFIKKVRNIKPEMDILVHGGHEEKSIVVSALKAGATGYILQGSTPRQLIEAIFDMHQGGAPMSPKIARMIVKEMHTDNPDEHDHLSKREKTILLYLCKGMAYKEIAEHLYISPNTVHTHVKHIYDKLQVKSRVEALRKAARAGII